jgi:hypothetical protein
MIKEAATDSFTAPVTGDAGWTSITSTTSFSSSALTFTSSASATGTRYFRIYFCDAAGNVGASATASATITMAAARTAPAFRGIGTVTIWGATPDIPAASQDGDLLIMVVVPSNRGSYTGWNRLGSAAVGGADVYWQIKSGTPASIAVQGNNAQVVAYSGVDQATPLDVGFVASAGAGLAVSATSSVSTPTARVVFMLVSSCYDDGNGSEATAGTFSSIAGATFSDRGGLTWASGLDAEANWESFGAQLLIRDYTAGAGSTGALTATYSPGASTNNDYAGWILVLRGAA